MPPSRSEVRLAKAIKSDPEEALRMAEHVLDQGRRAQSTRATRSRGRRRADAAAKGEAKASRSEVRFAALRRQGEQCALCAALDRGPFGPLHLHHIRGRQHERLEDVVMLCRYCHNEGPDSVHGGGREALRRLATYCLEHQMADAAISVGRRLARIEDAQHPPRRSTP